MSTPMTTAAFSARAPRTPASPQNALTPALLVTRAIISGSSIEAFSDRAVVSSIAVSSHLLVNVVIADPHSAIRDGEQCSAYLRDWDVMSHIAHPGHAMTNHPVWAVYREFVGSTIGGEADDVRAAECNDIPGYTDETIVAGIGYAVANLVTLRLGVTDETIDEFADRYSSLI